MVERDDTAFEIVDDVFVVGSKNNGRAELIDLLQ